MSDQEDIVKVMAAFLDDLETSKQQTTVLMALIRILVQKGMVTPDELERTVKEVMRTKMLDRSVPDPEQRGEKEK
jgi:mannitol/fructose-specific phosphotransferase system IIA component (Ntr-type)